MRLEVQRQPLPRVRGAAVMRLSGVIDTTTLNEFETRLEETRKDGIERLLLDLEKVRYINSSGFGALVKFSDQFKAKGGGLGLFNVPAKVQVVLEMLGLQAFFPIFATQAAAEEAMQSSAEFPAPEAPPEPAPAPAAPRAPAAQEPRAASVARSAPAAPSGPAYPGTFSCAVCTAGLEVLASGTYRCPGCGAVFEASPEGHLSFPSVEQGTSAVQVALDTGPTGRRVLRTLVVSLAEPLLTGRSTGEIAEALDELCRWIQGGSAPIRINVLLTAAAASLRLDITDSGPARADADLRKCSRAFSSVDVRRIGETRNLTRLLVSASGAPEKTPLLEARS
jgi:anti-anti-sigma factor